MEFEDIKQDSSESYETKEVDSNDAGVKLVHSNDLLTRVENLEKLTEAMRFTIQLLVERNPDSLPPSHEGISEMKSLKVRPQIRTISELTNMLENKSLELRKNAADPETLPDDPFNGDSD